MTTEERLDRIERLVQQDAENIHALARIAEAHEAAIEARGHEIAQLVREWQAYLRTIHPPQ
jgi:hypothetical protein